MLRFGTFIRVIKKGLAESSDEEVVNLLMRPLWDDESEYIDPAVVSKLISGNRKIKTAFRKRAIQPEYIKRVEINFRQRVVFNEETRHITINEIKHLVSSDDSIPQAKKDEWLGITNDFPALLTKVFLYTIGLDNQKPEGDKHNLSAELNFAQDEILGREDELKRISLLVSEGHKPIVIWGEGGIGKTELALKFCKGLDVSKCHFVRYHKSLKDTIAGLSFSNTPENHKKLSVEEKFEKHIEWLKEYDDTNLLILDNYDDDSKTLAELLADQDLARVCQLRFKLIITTRNKPQFPMSNAIHLESLPETELLELITHYYQRWEADGTTDDELIALIRALDGHTLCCELAAKTLQASHELKPKDVLVSLHGNNKEESLAIVDTEKDRRGYSGRITDHIKKLYTISSLNSEEIETMRYMLLTSPSGIDHSLLLDVNFGIQQAPLLALIKKGWLSKAQNTDLITIHPVVRSFCMLTKELQPTLVEEQFLDFIDNLYAFAGNPLCRSTYLHLELHTPYDEWRKEEKNFYRQWEQVESMMRFLVESVGQLVPVPVTIDQAKSYFDYVDTFLNLRQERNGPPIPWEYACPKRYLAKDDIYCVGGKLAFQMRQLAVSFLEANLPASDLFWGTAYDHMGRSYDYWCREGRSEQSQAMAKKYNEQALDAYLRSPSVHTTEIFQIYKRLMRNIKADPEEKLRYALSAVELIDEYSLEIPHDCADLCEYLAAHYITCAVHISDADAQWLLRAERKWYSVGRPFKTKLSPAQEKKFQEALQWLIREEHETLSGNAVIMEKPLSLISRSTLPSITLADLYKRIAYVYSALDIFEKELEYRLGALECYCILHDRTSPSLELSNYYIAIAQCQYDLNLYSDCLETCYNIVAIYFDLCVAENHTKDKSLCLKGDFAARILQNNGAELIAAIFLAICCCCKLEEYAQGIELWDKLEALNLQKHDTFERFDLGMYINMSICYGKQMDIEKQCDFEVKALAAKGHQGLITLQEFLDETIKIAALLIKQERFATAKHHLLTIINIYDEYSSQENIQINPKVYMAMAQCLQKLGNTERALTYALIYADTAGKKRYAKFLRWLQRLLDE